MDTKTLGRVEIKDADRGEVTAVFATLDVVDLDGDVTLPGAFEDGASVRISAYGHKSWEGALPVGKGRIRTVGKEAVLESQFFMNTTAGRDTFTVVKELGDLQEWSYGFDVDDHEPGSRDGRKVRMLKKLTVHEVSPVLLGAAGPGRTRTIGAKDAPLKFADEAELVMVQLKSLVGRAADVMAMRREKGGSLGAESAQLLEQVKGYSDELARLLADPAVPEVDDGLREALLREHARVLHRRIA